MPFTATAKSAQADTKGGSQTGAGAANSAPLVFATGTLAAIGLFWLF
jgi:hypothetical protein